MSDANIQLNVAVEAALTGYVSLQVGPNVCFYVSTSTVWPYETPSPVSGQPYINGANDLGPML